MNTVKIKNKLYITIGGITLIIILFLFLGLWPLLTILKNNSKKLIQLKNEASVLQFQNDEIEKFKKNYNSYKINLEEINQSFIDPKNPVAFITSIENIAANLNIQIKIASTPPNQKESQKAIFFQLAASGNFPEIIKFIENLEKHPFAVQIQSINISQPSNYNSLRENLSGQTDALIILKIFLKP